MEIFSVVLTSSVISSVVTLFGVTYGRKWVEEGILGKKFELDKKNYIHRVQFEKEFEIYKDIWKKLFDLKQKTLSLRPVMDFKDPDKSDDQIINERLQEFGDSYNLFLNSYATNQPFYSEDVYDCLKKISKTTRHEAVDYRHLDKKGHEYWEEAEKKFYRITKTNRRLFAVNKK